MPDVRHDCAGSTLRGLRACVRADIERAIGYAAAFSGTHAGFLRRLSFALTPPIMFVTLHRVAHLLHVRGWRRVARLVARANHTVHRADITPASCVGAGFYVPHTPGVVFHGTAGADLTLYYRACVLPAAPTSPTWTAATDAPRLGRGVTLGVFAVVHGAVTVGDDVLLSPTTATVADVATGASAISSLRDQARRRRARAASG